MMSSGCSLCCVAWYTHTPYKNSFLHRILKFASSYEKRNHLTVRDRDIKLSVIGNETDRS